MVKQGAKNKPNLSEGVRKFYENIKVFNREHGLKLVEYYGFEKEDEIAKSNENNIKIKTAYQKRRSLNEKQKEDLKKLNTPSWKEFKKWTNFQDIHKENVRLSIRKMVGKQL